MSSDLRYAVRQLSATPIATAVAIASLAVGIGANAAIFSLLNALLLRSLPIPDAGELVRIVRVDPAAPDNEHGLSPVMIDALRARQTVFSGLFAWSGGGISNIEANGSIYVGNPTPVSREYFSTLGLLPQMGRFFSESDPPSVAVISHGCWMRRYASDPAIIGKTIRVADVPLTIIGVAPEGFSGLNIDIADDLTILFGFRDPAIIREKTYLGVEAYARLRPGISIGQAQTELDALWPAIRAEWQPAWTGQQRSQFLSKTLRIQPAANGSSFLRHSYRRPLLILMAMVGALLLVACVNLANLTMARIGSRRAEFAIRIALGAGRWRLARQLLTESLLLSAAGASLGLLLATVTAPYLLSRMWSGFVPLTLTAALDARVLAFTALAAVLTTAIFGLFPAFRMRTVVDTPRTVRTGFLAVRWLAPGQVGLSFTLVVIALLFAGSLSRLHRADVGFRKDGLLVAQMYPLKGSEAQAVSGRAGYYRELASRLSNLPGVVAASYSHMGPLLRYESKSPASVANAPEHAVPAVFELVGPGFFELMGVQLLEGRDFSWNDDETKPAVAIISESLAQRLFPGGNAVGRQIDFGDKRNLEVIGVVNSASLWMPESREPMAVYRALLQEPTFNAPNLDLRISGPAAVVGAAVKKTLESLGRHTALRTQTLQEREERLLAAQHLAALLASFFGGIAVLLASIGLYGTLSQAVLSRTGEIGIRVAVGAGPVDIAWLIVKQVLLILVLGAIFGLPMTWVASRLVASWVYEASAADPKILVMAFATLAISALAAAYLPVRRAMAVNPIETLR